MAALAMRQPAGHVYLHRTVRFLIEFSVMRRYCRLNGIKPTRPFVGRLLREEFQALPIKVGNLL
jgi:hypothetical protein